MVARAPRSLVACFPALFIATLLVAPAIVVLTAPEASATHNTTVLRYTGTNWSLRDVVFSKTGENGEYAPLGDSEVIGAAGNNYTKVRLKGNILGNDGNPASCASGTLKIRQLSADINGIVDDGILAAPTLADGATSFDVTLGPRQLKAASIGGHEGVFSFTITIKVACMLDATNELTAHTDTFSSAGSPKVDVRLPAITVTTTPATGGAKVGIGQTYRIRVDSTDPAGEYTTNPGYLRLTDYASAITTVARDTNLDYTVVEGSPGTNGAKTFTVTARDRVYNVRTVTFTIPIDDRRPDPTNSFVNASVNLTNLEYVTTGSTTKLVPRGDMRATYYWTFGSGVGAGGEADVKGARVTRVPTNADATDSTGGTAASPRNFATEAGFTYSRAVNTHSWRVRLLDDANNAQPLLAGAGYNGRTAEVKDVPLVTFTCLSCGTEFARGWDGTSSVPAASKLGVIQGTITDNDLRAGLSAVQLYLRKETGEWLDPADNTFNVNGQKPKRMYNLKEAIGTNPSAATFTFDAISGVTLDTGRYVLGFVALDQKGNQFNLTVPLAVDGNAPRVNTGQNGILSTSITQDQPLRAKFNVTEGLDGRVGESGIAKINATVVGKTGRPRLSYLDGITHVGASCVTCLTPVTGGPGVGWPGDANGLNVSRRDGTVAGPTDNLFQFFTKYQANGRNNLYGEYTAVIPGLPVGEHYVHLDTTDAVGNTILPSAWRSETLTGTTGAFTVGPRVITAPPAVGKPPSPFYLDAAGDFNAHIWASYSNTTAGCQQIGTQWYCPVSEIRFEYKAGNTWTQFVATSAYQSNPIQVPSHVAYPNADARFFNYTVKLNKDLLPAGFAALEPINIRAIAVVKIARPSGNVPWEYKTTIEDIVRKPTGAGNVNIIYPATDLAASPVKWAMNFTGEKSKVRFNATLTVPNWRTAIGNTPPVVEYTLFNVQEQKYLRLDRAPAPGESPFLAEGDANKAAYTATIEALLSRCKGCTGQSGVWTTGGSTPQYWMEPKYLYNFSLDLRRPTQDPLKLTNGSKERELRQWMNPVAIPDGVYTFSVHFRTNDSAKTVLGQGSKPFTVESEAPKIGITYVHSNGTRATDIYPVVGPDGSTTNFVQKSFRALIEIDTGYANLTGSPQLALKRAQKIGNQGDWATNAPGMSLTVVDSTTIVNAKGEKLRLLNVTLTMPDEATHDRPYQLLINATTDLQQWKAPENRYKVSGPENLQIRMDTRAPSFALDSATVNATGLGSGRTDLNAPASERVLFGRYEEPGSGIEKMEIRVRDLTEGKTWNHEVFAWVAGTQERWAPATRTDVTRTGAPSEKWWVYGPTVGTTTFRSKLAEAPFHTYQIDMRGIDKVGNVATVSSTTFTFDGAVPTIHRFELKFDNNTFPRDDWKRFANGGILNTTNDNAPNLQNFPLVSAFGRTNAKGGNGTLQVLGAVSDDVCIASVNLLVTMPSGHVERVPLAKTANDKCPTSPIALHWKFDKVNAPFPNRILNQSGSPTQTGVYKVRLEVVDQAGKVTVSDKRYWFRVVDDFSAELKNAYFIPTTAGAGGLATLYADVFEDYRMGYVQVEVYRNNADGSYDRGKPLAIMNATPTASAAANGTGLWAITTKDMNVTLTVGSYTALVIVRDAAKHGSGTCAASDRTCTGVQLLVREGAPPTIEIRSPSRTAPFISKDVKVHAVVYSTLTTASGVSVQVGQDAGALEPVEAVVKPVSLEGRIVAFEVFYNTTVANASKPFFFNVTATDTTGITETDGFRLTVDGTPPTVSAQFDPRLVVGNTTYVRATSRLLVNATDDIAGVASAVCRVNGGPERDCATLALTGDDGAYTVNITAVDRAGNRAPPLLLSVTLDKTPPTVSVTKNEVDFVVTVEDAGVGVDESAVTVHYSTAEGADTPTTYTPLAMTRVTGNTYRADLPADATSIRYYVEALDLIGNAGRRHSAGQPGRIGEDPGPGDNRAPALAITAPADAATVRAPVVVTWTATDADGDVVTVDISYKRADGTGAVVAANLAATTGRFTWDASTLADGAYTLTLRASDGKAQTERSVTFTLRNRESRVIEPLPGEVTPGSTVNFAVAVDDSRPVRSVVVEYLKDGQPVGAPKPLSRTSGGAYADSFPAADAGEYTVRLQVQYEDGTREQVNVGSFRVAGSPIIDALPTWTAQFVMLITMSMATIALAAYAAFVRWKP